MIELRPIAWIYLLTAAAFISPAGFHLAAAAEGRLVIHERDYFERRGFNLLVFSNWYSGDFSDSKIAGVEIIHHGVRTATNGDVRLEPTPEQWDAVPELVERKVDRKAGRIDAVLKYSKHDFQYVVRGEIAGDDVLLSVVLEKPVPAELVGRAGLNLEFLPSAYFHKMFTIDGHGGNFPLYPGGSMTKDAAGETEPLPFARGKRLVLAPEDPERRISIEALSGDLAMYDGRNKAQNGWYVVRTLLPPDQTGEVVRWRLSANSIPDWIRAPMIAHSQVGYHPQQPKAAIIELDTNDELLAAARLLKIEDDGEVVEALAAPVADAGQYLRYRYGKFDFSSVSEPGIYRIEYGGTTSGPFRIAADVYANAWQPTLDVFFPVQMDHIFVNEAYRVWHGASHLDDALQAPVDHVHFDLYAQGPTTDTRYKPGEHIPGLNIGGWYDAGDFDIRTQSVYGTVLMLVRVWETFRPERDETTIDQAKRYVDIHVPDGKPDLLQQIEHGTLALVAQHRAVGHAIPGIVEAHLSQYTHLGDAVTKTDNLVYSAELRDGESDGKHSGTFDDRWAFTSRSTPLNYGSAAALAAASRALRGYNDELADECLTIAIKVWQDEHSHEPYLFSHGNTTGGPLDDEEFKAAVQLLVTTKEPQYAKRIDELWPKLERGFGRHAALAVEAMPHMGPDYRAKLEQRVKAFKDQGGRLFEDNPFGVVITRGGWAGGGLVIGMAGTNYVLHKAFPEIIGPEPTFAGLNFVYGCHPASNLSLVSAVGTRSKEVAYGSNRADYSFIAGGVVPGVLILEPDFPENKEDWPFLWGENEYVIPLGASYIYLVHAVNDLLDGVNPEPAAPHAARNQAAGAK